MEDTIKAHCNNCSGERRHEVLHNEETSWHETISDHYFIEGADTYEMIKCCGCGHLSLRHKSKHSEDRNENGDPNTRINYYPPALYRPKPKWINQLIWSFDLTKECFIYEIITEIYIALQNDSRRLAAMGVRALLEHIMIDKVGDNRSFNKNISKFYDKGFISVSQKEVLESVIEVGHATMHRSFNPSVEDLLIIIDVAESIIESIYINKQRRTKILINIPQKKIVDSNKNH